jgi:HEAT repeat protein
LLGECGEHARAAIPALRKGLDDKDEEVRGTAASALLQIDRDEVPVYLRPGVMKYPRFR